MSDKSIHILLKLAGGLLILVPILTSIWALYLDNPVASDLLLESAAYLGLPGIVLIFKAHNDYPGSLINPNLFWIIAIFGYVGAIWGKVQFGVTIEVYILAMIWGLYVLLLAPSRIFWKKTNDYTPSFTHVVIGYFAIGSIVLTFEQMFSPPYLIGGILGYIAGWLHWEWSWNYSLRESRRYDHLYRR